MVSLLSRVSNGVRTRVFPSRQDQELGRWYSDLQKDQVDMGYPLNSDSIVVDLGGFDGQWASDIFSKYQSNIFIFEAVPEFAKKTQERFALNSKIRVLPVALGGKDESKRISIQGVGSSLFRSSDSGVLIEVADAARLFELCGGIGRIDLMKMNIEGGEYDVFPRLFSSGLIQSIDQLQIQFHNLDSQSTTLVKEIHDELLKTHSPVWHYEWVWERWKRNPST